MKTYNASVMWLPNRATLHLGKVGAESFEDAANDARHLYAMKAQARAFNEDPVLILLTTFDDGIAAKEIPF